MNRRQMTPFGVRTNPIVVLRELPQDVVQVPLTEDEEFPQAFELDRLNHPLTPTVQVR